ncbi:MAG: efflux RND transporter periplasmic adaptor subunit [Sediminibacterium sp.]|jgi:cobalt-zinc-cadmium efflux system membrane fusion protein|nr:efflux RND transporter periplasmic adaptor subunit [Sediminibacterium sp.]
MKNIIYTIALIIAFSACNNSKQNTAEEHHEEENRVELTTAQFKTAGVTFGKVEMKNLSSTIQVNGMLDVPPQNLVTVSALMGGFIKSTELLQGMKVKKGDVIATIQNPDFIQIQQDYLDNKSKLKFAEIEFKRQEELAKDNVAAQKIYQQVSSEYNSLKAINSGLLEKLAILGINPSTVDQGKITSVVQIISPISGYVTAVNVNIGKYVNPQDVICEIVNTEHLHVELTVFERDLNKIQIGQKVRFYLVNEGGKERTATVYLINKKIDADRSVRVHAHLDKEEPNFVPGTYLKASIEVTNNQTTALPNEALVSSEGKFFIFIKDDGHGHTHKEEKETTDKHEEEEYAFTPIEVSKGVSQNGFTEVFLPDNFELDHAEVVIKGAYDLLAKMNNSEEEGHAH